MTGTAIDPEEQLLEGSRARRGETGPQLPDFELPEVTEEFRMLVGRCAREDVGVLAREVFKHLIGLQRYKLWAGKVNWFGTDGKSAVPENVRAKVMEMVHRRHKGDQEVAVRYRINEFLRIKRTGAWKPLRDPFRLPEDMDPIATATPRVRLGTPAMLQPAPPPPRQTPYNFTPRMHNPSPAPMPSLPWSMMPAVTGRPLERLLAPAADPTGAHGSPHLGTLI